jgi:acyl-CoA reductase-like NAD-dependent aldehyde dehydrogenase
MPTERTPEQKAVSRKARKAATAAGKAWKDLPRETRRKYLDEAAALPARNVDRLARRKAARKAAEAAGEKWENLSVEKRRDYLLKIRQNEK